MINRVLDLIRKTITSAKNDGISVAIKKIRIFLKFKVNRNNQKKAAETTCADVLFINGSYLQHPARYRVAHQREQLEQAGVSTAEVFYTELNVDTVRLYRCFVFFRCPYTDTVGEFIKKAKEFNKQVIFDIDDLVFDTIYTEKIPYIKSLSARERQEYDDSVERIKQTLLLCDKAITTTVTLAEELGKYIPKVWINRNKASKEMLYLSDKAYANRINHNNIRIGYFSGSITHDDDLKIVIPALERLLDEYRNLELFIVGEITFPPKLKRFGARIINRQFVDWKRLPELIAEVDINIAPISDSVFNRAKSENKWIEAALVRVPTIASNIGAFEELINEDTGVLCDDSNWYASLKKLIDNESERNRIGQNAYDYVTKNCLTDLDNNEYAKLIRSIFSPNVFILLPRVLVSGGVMVALKHGSVLKKNGYDVTILNEGCDNDRYMRIEEDELPVIAKREVEFNIHIDKAVATLWSTLQFVKEYKKISERYYLIQSFEPGFYEEGSERYKKAETTYVRDKDVKYLTVSKWCEKWLSEKYGIKARFIPNGIYRDMFYSKKRTFSEKTRILIEGNSVDKIKNIDEAFEIADKLDRDRFEIWYMSNQGGMKKGYRADRFLHSIPYNEVPEIYRSCDILLKSSVLESFSYPPLEMMATGGYVVVVPNEGNIEYLIDQTNCLMYKQGDIDGAVAMIYRIVDDKKLRERLALNGEKTAKSRDWKSIEPLIVDAYT